MYTEMDETEEITLKDLIKNVALENAEVFEIDGDDIFCKVCNLLVPSVKIKCLSEHLKTEKHIENCKEVDDVKEESLKRISNTELLKKYVLDYKDVFETDGSDLICKICKKPIAFDKSFLVRRHIKTQRHQTLAEKRNEAASKTQQDRELTVELLNKYVSEYNGIFETDGELLLCKVCKKSVSFVKKSYVENHLKTQKHISKYAQSIEKIAKDVDAKYFEKLKEGSFILQKFEDFCRTCMKQFSKSKQKDDKQRITEVPKGRNNMSIMKFLENIQPQIKVEINDNLPSLMCSDCIQKLLRSYDFIEMYQNVDKRLRKIVEKFDTDKHDNSLDKEQAFLEEVEMPVGFNVNSYDTEIVDRLEIYKKDNECIALKNEPIEDMSDIAENNDSGSEDEWVPEKSCIDVSLKQQNSNDSSKKIFKGFFQPEANENGSLTCQLCEKVLEGALLWRKHIRQNHLKEKLKKRNSKSSGQDGCSSDESKVFRGFIQPEANDDGSLTCQLCDTVIGSPVLWREHMHQKHLDENRKEAFNRRSNQPRKPNNSYDLKNPPPNEDGRYPCEFCGKTYPKLLRYRRHLRAHTGEPYLCNQCGKTFRFASSYHTHRLRHKGEKTFQCPKCPKSFVCQSGLYNHARSHNDNKPFVCNICGAAFHIAYELKIHNRYHIGLKKHKCEYCDMRFVTAEKQRRHMRTHTGEKPYRCKYCERAFAQSNDCIKHLRQHLGDNVYQCDICPLRFPLQRELRAHFASHKNDDEETRTRNLQARMEAEKSLLAKLDCKEAALV